MKAGDEAQDGMGTGTRTKESEWKSGSAGWNLKS
jgi:hypothetical protein